MAHIGQSACSHRKHNYKESREKTFFKYLPLKVAQKIKNKTSGEDPGREPGVVFMILENCWIADLSGNNSVCEVTGINSDPKTEQPQPEQDGSPKIP